jgi:hypothetical protein
VGTTLVIRDSVSTFLIRHFSSPSKLVSPIFRIPESIFSHPLGVNLQLPYQPRQTLNLTLQLPQPIPPPPIAPPLILASLVPHQDEYSPVSSHPVASYSLKDGYSPPFHPSLPTQTNHTPRPPPRTHSHDKSSNTYSEPSRTPSVRVFYLPRFAPFFITQRRTPSTPHLHAGVFCGE